MPNKWTFQIKPIAKLLREEMNGGTWVDPYSGENSPAQITNDINPKMPTKYHMDALEFVKMFADGSLEGAILDPPYSYRQISECYKSLGLKVDMHTTQNSFYTKVADELSIKIKPNGKIICCGWHSNGVGDKSNFEKTRILLVAHGGHHNDTIVTVERKLNETLG
jgi:hypothetical protein